MAVENLRRWICDICDHRMGTDLGAQPEGWTYLIMGGPPLANPDGQTRRHLCISCTTRVSLALLADDSATQAVA